ncbi:MAG: substrate-binding domain-containing protein [Clostridia bacterium]|nr:substrate-binding domain-containing protein [Clostridia bacterium]
MVLKKMLFFALAAVLIFISGVYLFSESETGINPDLNLKGINKKMELNIISKTGSSQGFLEEARRNFMRQNNVEINYIGIGTFDAIEYIVKHGPADAWISADETASQILEREYKKRNKGEEIIENVIPLVTSPLVLIGWEERMKKMENLSIDKIYKFVSQGKTWEEIGGESEWGKLKFSHTNPVVSNSGMQFMLLLVHNYYRNKGIDIKEINNRDLDYPEVSQYIKNFEDGCDSRESGSGTLMDSMIISGPVNYDIVVNYEYYALSNIKKASESWGNLRIYYPNPTIWSSRSFIILRGAKANKEKIEMLKKFRDYLLSDKMQKKAMLEGYRPANIMSLDLTYLEEKFSRFGFKKDIEADIPVPDMDVIEGIRNTMRGMR